jgi:hypothetical protein
MSRCTNTHTLTPNSTGGASSGNAAMLRNTQDEAQVIPVGVHICSTIVRKLRLVKR